MTIDLTTLRAEPVKADRRRQFQAFRYFDGPSLVAKTCTSCGVDKGIGSFNRNARSFDKLMATCKECHTSDSLAAQKKILEGNPSYWRESKASQATNNSSRSEQELSEAFKNAAPEKACYKCGAICPTSSFYRKRLRTDGLSERCKACDKQSRDERRAQRYKKHWTSQGIPFDFCIYCQMMTDLTPGDLHGDHVIARKLGGPDEMSNIAPACRSCNICKGEDTLEKFLAEQFFYEEDRQEILDRLRQYGYVA